MGKKLSFIAGSVSTLLFIFVLFFWPSGCSHTPTLADGGVTPAHLPASLLPHPAFAYARGKHAGVSIADIAEKSLPAVVNISSTKIVRQPGGAFRSPFFADPFFRQFFGGRGRPFRGIPQKRRERSLGSGVIVSSDGTILTNNHVVKDADTIKVTLSDKREFDAKVLGTDPKSDLAVIKLKGTVSGLHPLPFGDSSRLRLGDVVIAIGNPFGVGQTVTMGIVSAKGRANVGITDYEDFIQTDAAINPGNSGGPLINMAGELVGINTAILSRSGGYQGIGFAIPSNMARPIMESLEKHGKVIRGWLGVVIQDLNEKLAKALDLPSAQGVLISDVSAGSPAEKAGLKRGDVVVKINDEVIKSTGQLRNLIAAAGKSAKIKIEVIRDKAHKTFDVALGELPSSLGGVAKIDRKDGILGGLTVTGISPSLREKLDIPKRITQGVVVKDVTPGSPAASAGLHEGDVIIELNRKPIKGVDDFTRLQRDVKDRVLLLVYRRGSTLYLLLSR